MHKNTATKAPDAVAMIGQRARDNRRLTEAIDDSSGKCPQATDFP